MRGAPLENVERIWADLQTYYREFKPSAQLEMLKLSSFSFAANWRKRAPCLKSKANNLRHTGAALLHVWCKYMTTGSLIHQQIKLALERSSRMEAIITEQKVL